MCVVRCVYATLFAEGAGAMALLLPRVRWMFQMVADCLELPNLGEVEASLRDADSTATINSFMKGHLESIVFLHQSKEVRRCTARPGALQVTLGLAGDGWTTVGEGWRRGGKKKRCNCRGLCNARMNEQPLVTHTHGLPLRVHLAQSVLVLHT
jgi:hypothetical protein